MKPKNFLYILIAIAIIAIIAFIVYQFIPRGSGTLTTGTSQTGSLPSVASGQFPSSSQPTQAAPVATFNANGANASSSQFGIISNDPALDYFVDAANTVVLIKTDGAIESIANGKTSVIGSSTISNVVSAAFSYDGKKVLETSRVGTTTQASVLDLTSQIWTRLPDGMQSPVWSPTNYQIAYLAPSTSGSETLMTIDEGAATNTKPFSIIPFNMEDLLLQWPNGNTIAISDRPSAYTTGSIWLLNIPSKTLSSVVYENLGAESLWDASGSALIFSAGSDNAGGQLVFRNASSSEKTLSFSTLPSKCTFNSPVTAGIMNPSLTIYCAVPSDQGTFSIARLPDEYDQNIYFTNDDFYSIDSGTGLLTKIFSSSAINQNIDAKNMKVFNNVLFFVDRYDQKLYALSLKG